MGALTGQELLLIGAFAPQIESSTWLTLQLAAEEINGQGGLPTGSGAGRPLIVVACEDRIRGIETSMLHLDRLGVRGILASLEELPLQAAFSLPATRRSSLLLTPNGSALAASEAAAPLLWSLGTPTNDAAPSYPQLIQLAEQTAVGRGANPELLRVASLVSAAAEDDALERSVRPLLELGGKGADQLIREDRLRIVPLSDDSSDERAQALASLAQYAPDIILVFLGGSFDAPKGMLRSNVLRSLEEIVSSSASWRPLYILGPRNLRDPLLRWLARSSASFRARAAGATADPISDSILMTSLASRFELAFPESTSVGAELGVEPGTYDAFYYLAYALAAAPRGGTDLAAQDVLAGLEYVTDDEGERVDVGPGPDGLEKATALLSAQISFDTYGATGSAASSGGDVRTADPRVYCFGEAGDVESPSSPAALTLEPPPPEGTTSASSSFACTQDATDAEND